MQQPSSTNHPTWWHLYLVLPLMAVLLVGQHLLDVPAPVHEVLELAAVLVTFGLVAFWMSRQKGKESHSGAVPLVVTRVPAVRHSASALQRMQSPVTYVSVGKLEPRSTSPSPSRVRTGVS